MRCPLNCSGRGMCDSMASANVIKAIGASTAASLSIGIASQSRGACKRAGWYVPSPRIYVYDPTLHGAPPAASSEYDLALTERLLLSPIGGRPFKSRLLRMAGPNLSPKSKLKHVRMRWPYWNDTVAKSLGARHILTTLASAVLATRPPAEPQAAVTLSSFFSNKSIPCQTRRCTQRAASARLVLSLNGMSDFKSEQRRYNNSGYYEQIAAMPCLLPSGVDIVIPPFAATIDAALQ